MKERNKVVNQLKSHILTTFLLVNINGFVFTSNSYFVFFYFHIDSFFIDFGVCGTMGDHHNYVIQTMHTMHVGHYLSNRKKLFNVSNPNISLIDSK